MIPLNRNDVGDRFGDDDTIYTTCSADAALANGSQNNINNNNNDNQAQEQPRRDSYLQPMIQNLVDEDVDGPPIPVIVTTHEESDATLAVGGDTPADLQPQQRQLQPRRRHHRRRSSNSSYSRDSFHVQRRNRPRTGNHNTNGRASASNNPLTSLAVIISLTTLFLWKFASFCGGEQEQAILSLFFTMLAIAGVGALATLLICLQDRLEDWNKTRQGQNSRLLRHPPPILAASSSTINDSSSTLQDNNSWDIDYHQQQQQNSNNGNDLMIRHETPPSIMASPFAMASKLTCYDVPKLRNNRDELGSCGVQQQYLHQQDQSNQLHIVAGSPRLPAEQQQQQQQQQQSILYRRPSHSSQQQPLRSSVPSLNSILEHQLEDQFDCWWKELDSQTQYFALLLGYTPQTWDADLELEDLECEEWEWNDLTPEQQAAAIYFGYTQQEWDVD
jgi:hypothetical protein